MLNGTRHAVRVTGIQKNVRWTLPVILVPPRLQAFRAGVVSNTQISPSEISKRVPEKTKRLAFKRSFRESTCYLSLPKIQILESRCILEDDDITYWNFKEHLRDVPQILVFKKQFRKPYQWFCCNIGDPVSPGVGYFQTRSRYLREFPRRVIKLLLAAERSKNVTKKQVEMLDFPEYTQATDIASRKCEKFSHWICPILVYSRHPGNYFFICCYV